MAQVVSRRDLLAAGMAAVGSGAVAATLRAADDAKGDKSGKTEKGAARNPLSTDSLGTMLAALGLKATRTETRYDFTFTAKQGEEWNLSMSAALSTNEKSIWIMAWLDELPQSSADVPRTALLRLLSDNDKIGNGIFFAYVSTNRRFVLQRVIENDDVSSASFKADLLELAATVVNTYSHWAVANWKQLGTAAAAKDATDEGKSAGSRPAAPAGSRTATRDDAAGAAKKR